MSLCILIIDAPHAVQQTTEQISHPVEKTGLALQVYADPTTAFTEVQESERSGFVPVVILLGPHLENPVGIARQLHRLAPLAHLVFLTTGNDTMLRHQLQSPFTRVGTQWGMANVDGTDLSAVLQEAVAAARQRHQLRKTLDRINTELASTPPPEVSEQLRYRVSERFYANILEHAHDAIIATTNHGLIITWNNAAERIFGLPANEAQGRALPEVAGGAWSERLPPLLEQLQRADTAYCTEELVCQRMDGQTLYVELTLSLVRDQAGAAIGISVIVRDIAARKRAENALRESEERLRAILDNSPSLIYMLDTESRYIFVNRQWETVTGTPRDEVVGTTPYDFWPKETAEAFIQSHQEIIEQRTFQRREEMVAHGNRMHTYLSLKFPLLDSRGMPYAICGISTDITDRKRADEQFRMVVEAAPNAMLMVDPQGEIVLTNRQAETLFGYTHQELMGMRIEALIPDRFRKMHQALRSGYFASPTAWPMGAVRDLTALHKDGTELPVEIGLASLETDEGVFVLSAISDNRLRKQFEDRLRQANIELERRVEQRTKKLTEVNERLERSNLELQRFAYVASHDLQSPLRSISGYLQLLRADYDDQLDAQAAQWINRIVENTSRMQTLIQDLLTYTRVDSRARQFSLVEWNEIFDTVVDSLEASIRAAHAEVTRDSLPQVSGDGAQLVQLLQSLIENALRYNTSPQPQIHVSAQKEEREWIFSVRDNGIGIEEQYHKIIFEIFQRLHTQKAYPGSGIGLAVCRRIVHRHGGRIWVESQPDEGSIFCFTLPERDAAL